jgi:monothiol glutaredoxin
LHSAFFDLGHHSLTLLTISIVIKEMNMPLTDELRSRIESTIASNKVVLFMKGTPQQPQCGFSATLIGILNNVVSDYETVNVLADQEIREGIKEYSQWPTIPQLYVGREFIGGCDVVQQMYATGQLHETLGLEPVERITPAITISDTAASAIRNVMADNPGIPVHLSIDANWKHEFSLAQAKGHEVSVAANGIDLLLDIDSARRADGLEIDMSQTPEGMGMSIKNPNAPAPAPQMSVEELKAKMDARESLYLVDVREIDERERAVIEGSRLLDEETVNFIDTLARDAQLVFHCHTGQRSQAAADFFGRQGYTNVHNLAGGIDAWSQRIDPDVPRY